jgi:hypothetical protein
VPGPVPIVSPVVPLFSAPLFTPDPTLGRLVPFAAPLLGLGLAGETAESPAVVVEPVLEFCAKAKELEKLNAIAAKTEHFICFLQFRGNGSGWARECTAPVGHNQQRGKLR